MPRSTRKISSTGVYHAVWRGNNKITIFKDQEDYRKFLSLLEEKRKEKKYILYAWCLMPNHVHILLKEKNQSISVFFQELGSAFVSWYNRKYERVGHLFQGRFYSEPVEDWSYFFTVIRYIHVNPIQANICKLPEDYPYSTYLSYACSPKTTIFGMMTKEEFIQFHREKVEDICLDFEENKRARVTDEEAHRILARLLPEVGPEKISGLTRDQRTILIQDLLEADVSYRQIQKMTEIRMSVIRAAAKEMYE